MKTFTQAALVLLVLFSASACAEPPASETDPMPVSEAANPLEGSWELMYRKAVFPDSTVVREEAIPFELKLFTSTHHTYIMRDAEGSFISAGGGAYTFEGDAFSETHAYQSVPAWVGHVATWQVRFEQDRFHMTGPTKVVNAQGDDVTAEVQGVLGQVEETFRRVR